MKRSERNWAGLPTDLVIEQTLRRSLKTSDGMTRGGGMSEIQRSMWLLLCKWKRISMCYTQQVNNMLQINTLQKGYERHNESGGIFKNNRTF